MNHHAPIPATAEPAEALPDSPRAIQAKRFRSYALQLRRNSHHERQWARNMLERGHRAAAEGFTKAANKYAADALWYWRRANPKT